jgi:hypothetical protein
MNNLLFLGFFVTCMCINGMDNIQQEEGQEGLVSRIKQWEFFKKNPDYKKIGSADYQKNCLTEGAKFIDLTPDENICFFPLRSGKNSFFNNQWKKNLEKEEVFNVFLKTFADDVILRLEFLNSNSSDNQSGFKNINQKMIEDLQLYEGEWIGASKNIQDNIKLFVLEKCCVQIVDYLARHNKKTAKSLGIEFFEDAGGIPEDGDIGSIVLNLQNGNNINKDFIDKFQTENKKLLDILNEK